MPLTHDRTERPHGALLQADIGFRNGLYRIGGRLRTKHASVLGVALGIPLYSFWNSNLLP